MGAIADITTSPLPEEDGLGKKRRFLWKGERRVYVRAKVRIMNIIKINIDGLLIIEPRLFRGSRGYFFESFSEREFDEKVTPILGHKAHFCQDNECVSRCGAQ